MFNEGVIYTEDADNLGLIVTGMQGGKNNTKKRLIKAYQI